MEEPPKETVIIVHGTWAAPKRRKARWYQPVHGIRAEGFVSKLDAALHKRGSPAHCWAHCTKRNRIFQWSGENSWIARTDAASNLGDYIAQLRNEGWRCHIVAHSHGGNVVVEALPKIMAAQKSNEPLGKIVTLGTPFTDTMSPVLEKAEWRRTDLKAISSLLLILMIGRPFRDNLLYLFHSIPLIAIMFSLPVIGAIIYYTVAQLTNSGLRADVKAKWKFAIAYCALWTSALLTSLWLQAYQSAFGLGIVHLVDEIGRIVTENFSLERILFAFGMAILGVLIYRSLAHRCSFLLRRSLDRFRAMVGSRFFRNLTPINGKGFEVTFIAICKYWSAHWLFWIIALMLILPILFSLLNIADYVIFHLRVIYLVPSVFLIPVIYAIISAVVLIGILQTANLVLFKLGRTGRAGLWANLNEASQAQRPRMLAIGSQTDEAWQLLYHMRQSGDPLSIRTNLLIYLSSSVRRAISRKISTARILGAKSYGDLGSVAKVVTALMHLLTLLGMIYFGYRAYMDQPVDAAIVSMVAGLLVLLGFTTMFGISLLSVFWSPFRWCLHLASSLANLPAEVGTYLVRGKSWSLLLGMIMGLEGYRFKAPLVEQCPSNIPEKFLKYEDMPKGAERRALKNRNAWVARHLGDVSETFSKLAVTAADITSLLRRVEEDQTLVHAAYYTDNKCIARIADWIAGKESASEGKPDIG